MFDIIETNTSSGGDAIGSTTRAQLVGIPKEIFNRRSMQAAFISNSLARCVSGVLFVTIPVLMR
jgi:hypothetical protein